MSSKRIQKVGAPKAAIGFLQTYSKTDGFRNSLNLQRHISRRQDRTSKIHQKTKNNQQNPQNMTYQQKKYAAEAKSRKNRLNDLGESRVFGSQFFSAQNKTWLYLLPKNKTWFCCISAKTNSSPLKISCSKSKPAFQPSIFRCKLAASFRDLQNLSNMTTTTAFDGVLFPSTAFGPQNHEK